jgi:hypothetical protein
VILCCEHGQRGAFGRLAMGTDYTSISAKYERHLKFSNQSGHFRPGARANMASPAARYRIDGELYNTRIDRLIRWAVTWSTAPFGRRWRSRRKERFVYIHLLFACIILLLFSSYSHPWIVVFIGCRHVPSPGYEWIHILEHVNGNKR